MEKIISKEDALELVSGTHLVGKLVGYTYNQLVKVLGEPTLDEEKDPYSGDGKTNVEWVFRDLDGEHFIIYDWKTYDEDYTTTLNQTWNVGGKVYAGEFVTDLIQILRKKN